jgi:ribosome-associated protein
VQVNGQIEARRGAQLHPGDVVTVAGQRVRPVELPLGP